MKGSQSGRPDGIEQWLERLGLSQYAATFTAHAIDFDVLADLCDADLEGLGIPLGDRKRLLRAIGALGEPAEAGSEEPAAVHAERRQLTVMFADLVGSTELAARLDPEDMGDVIRAFQTCCQAVVEGWEGYVARYMGDGILVYFSYPRAHEDDPERAARAGLELVAAVARLQPREGVRLQARVGIATGQVVVGEMAGTDAAQEQAVVGATPNLAARLQSIAEPGAVLIAANTQRLLGQLFEVVDLGRQDLKGFPRATRAWRVVRESAAVGRFEALRGASLTPLIGREHEIGSLLQRWQQAKAGEGQVVLLSGEAGIGKSRLSEALREQILDEPHTRLRYYCSPFYINSPLYPMIQQVERVAGLGRDDDAAQKLDKLEALLGRSTDAPAAIVPLLAALWSIPVGERYPPLELSPERQREETLAMLLEQLAGLAARQPVLMVFEDLHWIDPTSLELLDQVVERAPDLPLLAVFTFRPEFRPSWTGLPHVTVMALNRLGPRHGAAMVEMVAKKALPTAVLDQIVTKTDGVPLFVEELTKTVLESDLLADAGARYELAGQLQPLAIPSSLHDSLLARLDRLAPTKEVAQIGAVIGREFSHQLIAAVAPLGEAELNQALFQLVGAEMLQCRGTPPLATYSFKHALMQDAAYQSLIKSRRRHYHERIFQVLGARFPEVVEAHPELMAQHAAAAGLTGEAITYWERAGHHAMLRSSHAEAIAHLQQALDLVAKLPDEPETARLELRLQHGLGQALMATKGYAAAEVEQAYARARALCQRVDAAAEIFPVLASSRAFYATRGDFRAAQDIAEQCQRLAEDSADPKLLLSAAEALGITLIHLGEPVAARTYLERAIELYDPERRRGPPRLQDPKVDCLSFLSWAFWLLGQPEQGLQRAQAAITLAGELNHPFSLAFAQMTGAILHALRGEPRESLQQAEAALAIATEQRFEWLRAGASALCGAARAGLTTEEAGLAQAEAGVVEIEAALNAYRATGARGQQPYVLTQLAKCHAAAGQTEAALRVLTEALDVLRDNQELWWEPEVHRLTGEVLSSHGAAKAEVEERFLRALEQARRQQARSFELRAATSLARLWQAQGARAKAHDLLAPLYAGFTEGFETQDLRDAKALLTGLAGEQT